MKLNWNSIITRWRDVRRGRDQVDASLMMVDDCS